MTAQHHDMARRVFMTLACFVFGLFIAFDPSSARADACDAAAADIVVQLGAKFQERARTNAIVLKHPAANTFSIDCNADSAGSVTAYAKTAFPAARFYDLIGAAAVIAFPNAQATANDIRDSAIKCQTSALKTKDEYAEVSISDVVGVNCYAFTREGGASGITVFKKQ